MIKTNNKITYFNSNNGEEELSLKSLTAGKDIKSMRITNNKLVYTLANTTINNTAFARSFELYYVDLANRSSQSKLIATSADSLGSVVCVSNKIYYLDKSANTASD